jgi:threonine/homoserine/homoserine lactone efflux protein
MVQAVGEILPMAVGVAISPVPIVAIVLVLGTPLARTNGPAFAVGWLLGLSAAGAITLMVTSEGSRDGGDQPTWVTALSLVVGLLFVLIAVRTWRSRPRGGDDAGLPSWMHAVDRFTTGKSLAAGLVLSAVNPKNLALTIAAAVSIAAAGVSTGEDLGTLAVFVLLGSVSILAPVAIYFAMGERAVSILGGIKNWLAAHSAAITTVLLLVIGAKLIGDGLGGLS